MNNIENELWVKLKDEIKTEILDELRAKTVVQLRDELVKSVMFKVEKLIFEERYFETPLKTYIKSLCYEDVHYLRMLNLGLVKQGNNIIPVSEKSTGEVWMTLRKNVNTNMLYEEYKGGGLVDCSFENFISILNFDSAAERLIWQGKGKSKFSYLGLFDLYNRIYDYDFSNLNPLLKQRFLLYLSVKFIFDGETKEYENIKKSFNKEYGNKFNSVNE